MVRNAESDQMFTLTLIPQGALLHVPIGFITLLTILTPRPEEPKPGEIIKPQGEHVGVAHFRDGGNAKFGCKTREELDSLVHRFHDWHTAAARRGQQSAADATRKQP